MKIARKENALILISPHLKEGLISIDFPQMDWENEGYYVDGPRSTFLLRNIGNFEYRGCGHLINFFTNHVSTAVTIRIWNGEINEWLTTSLRKGEEDFQELLDSIYEISDTCNKIIGIERCAVY